MNNHGWNPWNMTALQRNPKKDSTSDSHPYLINMLIRILEINGYPKSIIEDAIAVSKEADLRQLKMMNDF